MDDAIVAARMSRAKKEAGTRVLESLESNASQFINEAYDYLIAHGDSPFAKGSRQGERSLTRETLAEALAAVDAMCLPADNRFAAMNDDEIKRERLIRRGLA